MGNKLLVITVLFLALGCSATKKHADSYRKIAADGKSQVPICGARISLDNGDEKGEKRLIFPLTMSIKSLYDLSPDNFKTVPFDIDYFGRRKIGGIRGDGHGFKLDFTFNENEGHLVIETEDGRKYTQKIESPSENGVHTIVSFPGKGQAVYSKVLFFECKNFLNN